MKRWYYLCFALAFAAITSCTDDPNDSDIMCSLETQFMLQTGNSWVFEAYEIDEDGAKIPGTERVDSTVVQGTNFTLDRTAYTLITYKSADAFQTFSADTVVLAVGDGSAHILSPSLIDCECFGPAWLAIANCDVTAFEALDTTITGESLPVRVLDDEGKEIIINTSTEHEYTTVHSADLLREEITTPAGAFEAWSYGLQLTHDFRIIEPLEATFVDGSREIVQTRSLLVWVVENTGFVKIRRTHTSSSPDIPTVNEEKVLLRYSVQ